MKRTFIILIVAVMLLTALAACASPAPAASTEPGASTAPATSTEPGASTAPATSSDTNTGSEKPFKIGYVMLEETGNSYNILEVMQKYCADRGYELIYESANVDNEKTVSITQNFIAKGCNALFVYTVDSGTMATVKGICDQNGTKVAFTGLMEEGYIEICDNEHDQGVFGAEKMIEAAANKWGAEENIDLIIVTEATEVGDGNRIRMHEAFVPKLLEEYPYYPLEDVLWVDCGLDLLKASSEIANHLSAHPDAKNILIPVFFNTSGGQGAMNALKAAGREDQAIIVSYHITDSVTEDYIKNSPDTWVGSAYFPPESYVRPLFEVAMDKWAKGEEVENQFIYSAYEWVTHENIDNYDFPFDKE
jgi:ABC-type sugar transport system substrate-binding protein